MAKYITLGWGRREYKAIYLLIVYIMSNLNRQRTHFVFVIKNLSRLLIEHIKMCLMHFHLFDIFEDGVLINFRCR